MVLDDIQDGFVICWSRLTVGGTSSRVLATVVELGASNAFGRRGTCKNRDGLDDLVRRRGSGQSRS